MNCHFTGEYGDDWSKIGLIEQPEDRASQHAYGQRSVYLQKAAGPTSGGKSILQIELQTDAEGGMAATQAFHGLYAEPQFV